MVVLISNEDLCIDSVMLTGSFDDVVTSTRGFDLVHMAGIAHTNNWLCFLLSLLHSSANCKIQNENDARQWNS